MKKLLLICCLLSICFYGQSQKKWTLKECVDYATKNNIQIKQQMLSVDNKKIDLNTSKNSRLPNLNAKLDQSFKFGRTTNMEGFIVSHNSNGASFSVGSTTPIFTGFKISNQIDADKFNLQAAMAGLKKAVENLELQIASLYLEVLFNKEIVKVYQDQAELSKTQLNKTEILYTTKKIPESQLFDMKAQLAKDEVNITTAKNDLDQALLKLAQALNLEDVNGFDIEAPSLDNAVAENHASLLPIDHIYKTAIAIKPHVKEAEFNLESSKKMMKVAQSGYYPTLDFSLGYGTNVQNIYGMPDSKFSEQIKNHANQYIGFTLTVPIFNRFEVRNNVRKARLNIINYNFELDLVKQTLQKDIQQAHQNAVASRSKYVATEKSFAAADESFKYVVQRYEVGRSTVFEYNEAQTKLLNSKSEHIQAKYDFLFRTKILDFYNGTPIDIK